MPRVNIRYRIPNTEDVLEVVVEYEEGSTIGQLKPQVRREINKGLEKLGLPPLKIDIILVPGAPYNGEI